MSNSIKYLVTIFCFLTDAVLLKAQPTSESQRGAYSAEQVRQKRETEEMNRHYESMKPAGSNNSASTNNSGSYIPYQPYKYSEKARQQYLENQRLEKLAAMQKLRAEQQQVFFSRKERFAMELVNKGITKTKENYGRIINAAVSNCLPDTFYYRVFGKNIEEFEQKIISNDNTVNFYFPSPSRMMRPTGNNYYYNTVQNNTADQPVPATNTALQNDKTDIRQSETAVLDGLRLKDKPVDTIQNRKEIYNKLLIKPRKDSLQESSNSIYKSLQLKN